MGVLGFWELAPAPGLHLGHGSRVWLPRIGYISGGLGRATGQ